MPRVPHVASRSTRLLWIAIVALTAADALAATNPVKYAIYGTTADFYGADPGVYRVPGTNTYYLVKTGSGRIFTSGDLQTWSDKCGTDVIPNESDDAERTFWAPELYFSHGHYLVGVTIVRGGKHVIRYYQSTGLCTPFHATYTLASGNGDHYIDGTVYYNPANARYYVIYKVDTQPNARIEAREASFSCGGGFFCVTGSPVTLVDTANPSQRRLWMWAWTWGRYSVEGPSVTYNSTAKRHYLFFSAGAWRINYSIGEASASCFPCAMTVYGNPIMQDGGGFSRPGHGMVIDMPHFGGLGYFFHAFQQGKNGNPADPRLLVRMPLSFKSDNWYHFSLNDVSVNHVFAFYPGY